MFRGEQIGCALKRTYLCTRIDVSWSSKSAAQGSYLFQELNGVTPGSASVRCIAAELCIQAVNLTRNPF